MLGDTTDKPLVDQPAENIEAERVDCSVKGESAGRNSQYPARRIYGTI